ncbi:MAG: hypothetical protein ACRC6M_17100 [Microcystaceae cyanobacterium]
MKARFKFLLIRHVSQPQARGFVLPMTIAIGLVVLVVGATLMIRATGDQQNATSQKATMVANSAAETGMTRLQDFLNKYPYLAKSSLDEWTTLAANPNSPMMEQIVTQARSQSCEQATQSKEEVKSNIQKALVAIGSGSVQALPKPDSSNSTLAPHYQIKKYYYYTDGTAKVLVQGQAGSNAKAIANLTATTPVAGDPVTSLANTVPVLWVRQYVDFGANATNSLPGKGDGDVVLDACMSQTIPTPTANKIDEEDYQTYLTNNTTTIVTNPDSVNPGTGPAKVIKISLKNGRTLTKSDNPMPMPPVMPSNAKSLVKQDLVGKATTLPLAADLANAKGAANYDAASGSYLYQIDSLSDSLVFASGQKVTLYVNGPINFKGGSSSITHTCASGSNCAQDVTIIGNSSTPGQQFISLDGNQKICNVWVWAPDYIVDLSGGGNAKDCAANASGIYWVKGWNGGGQGVHIANAPSTNWNGFTTATTQATKNKMSAPTQWAMVDSNYNLQAP